MHASVIVPARNAEHTISRTLASLARQDLDGDYEVIVVDDGSGDRTAELARQAPGPVTVLSQRPAGPAVARNLGASRSRGSALAFCDADVFPTDGWLAAGLQELADADIVQGKVLPDPLATLGPFDRTIWVTFEGGLWETANLFIRRELFERLGGFRDQLSPSDGKPLAEDVFLGYSAQRLGARAAFSPSALAYHAVFPRRWPQYVAERRRLAYFPLMARKAPELRGAFLYRQVFLNTRSARLDLGLAGVVFALVARSTIPLLAAGPYLRTLQWHSRRSRPIGPPAVAVAAADLAADLVGLAAMACGSARYGSLVL